MHKNKNDKTANELSYVQQNKIKEALETEDYLQ